MLNIKIFFLQVFLKLLIRKYRRYIFIEGHRTAYIINLVLIVQLS